MGACFASTAVALGPKQTVEDAWRDVYERAGFESGHSYSGGFGSKPGMVVVARLPKAGVDAIRGVEQLLDEDNYQETYLAQVDQDCSACPWPSKTGMKKGLVPMQVSVRVYSAADPAEQDLVPKAMLKRNAVTEATVFRPCRVCGGTGKVPLPDDRIAANKAKAELIARQRASLVMTPSELRRLRETVDDKWGPAAAVVGDGCVWFGGYCSS